MRYRILSNNRGGFILERKKWFRWIHLDSTQAWCNWWHPEVFSSIEWAKEFAASQHYNYVVKEFEQPIERNDSCYICKNGSWPPLKENHAVMVCEQHMEDYPPGK